VLDESSQKFAFQNTKAQRLTFDYLKKNYGGRGGGSMLSTKFTSVTLSIIVIYSMFYSTLGVRIKLGRQTAHFSYNENFSLDFLFSVARPKTKMPRLLFVIADNRKSSKKCITKNK